MRAARATTLSGSRIRFGGGLYNECDAIAVILDGSTLCDNDAPIGRDAAHFGRLVGRRGTVCDLDEAAGPEFHGRPRAGPNWWAVAGPTHPTTTTDDP